MVYLTYNLMVVSYWNSTSNHNGHMRCILLRLVVSYWNSTSNHNSRYRLTMSVLVVSYWNSTSNHNSSEPLLVRWWLYLIEILHQTTTLQPYFFATLKLYLIEILHQTTTMYSIAPRTILLYLIEILHQTTTEERARFNQYLLYLIEILHQTTTLSIRLNSFQGCILLKFYIKPQLYYYQPSDLLVVSYWNSTSNHNVRPWIDWYIALYIKIIIIEKFEFTLWRSQFDVFQHVKEQDKYTQVRPDWSLDKYFCSKKLGLGSI